MKYLKASSVVLLLALAVVVVLTAQERSLFILHTNNTNGALENCYCPDHPLGAMEKRVIFVNQFILNHPNTILVDAGDLLSVSKRDFKDSLVVKAYSLMPYDAILPGDQEVARDQHEVNRLLSLTGATILGTNLAIDIIQGMVSYRIVERSGIRVAIMGVMDSFALKYYPQEIKDRLKLKDPVSSVRTTRLHLDAKADVFIVLTHQGAGLDRELAKAVKGLDVIIGAHSQSVIREAEEVNGVLITQAGKEGYYVGVVEVKLEGKKILSKSGRLETMSFMMPYEISDL